MDALANLFIRHPRAQYSLANLGSSRFEYDNCQVIRKDFEVENERRHVIRGSCFLPSNCCSSHCIVYMHGSAGSRLDAFADCAVEIAICCRLPLVTFDFAGAGLSDGDYISLGFREEQNIATVVTYLKEHLGKWIASTSTSRSSASSTTTAAATVITSELQKSNQTINKQGSSSSHSTQEQTKFCLWGRSMGAVASLLFSVSHPSDVCGLILDSPFSQLWTLSEHLIKQWYASKPVIFAQTLSGMTSATALPLVRAKILSLIPGFDIKEFAPLNFASRASAPVLFVHGKEDTFVLPSHSQLVYEAYGKDVGSAVEKRYCLVKGSHNERRPPSFLDEVLDFLCAHSHARSGRRYFPALFQPSPQNGNFGLAVLPFLKESPTTLSGKIEGKVCDASDSDFATLLPEALSSTTSASISSSQSPPFRRERILCVHCTQGISLLQPLTGKIEFSEPYAQINKFGVLESGDGVYLWSQRESEARLFWCETEAACQFRSTVSANIEGLIQEQLQGDRGATRQKMLGNVEYAAGALIDSELTKGLQPDLSKIVLGLYNTFMEVLGPEEADSTSLRRDIAEIVLRVARAKLMVPDSLDVDAIVDRCNARNQTPQPSHSTNPGRKKSCVIA